MKNKLTEAKQIGLLYHFTDSLSLNKILSEDKLNGSKLDNKDLLLVGVSTTRNKNLNYDGKKNNIRITLDGNKLSNTYKIQPYDYWYRLYNVPANDHVVDEDEEFIVTPKGAILNINKYILEITKL